MGIVVRNSTSTPILLRITDSGLLDFSYLVTGNVWCCLLLMFLMGAHCSPETNFHVKSMSHVRILIVKSDMVYGS